jgi:ElaB/YqjD/DUF883 family membrane-anchored ribosome-binding protein
MVADNNSSAGEITEQPIHGNGDTAAQAVADQAEDSGGKSYRTEEFVRVRKQLVDRLDRVKEEIARVDAEDVGRKVAVWVKENPLLSAAIAAGTGILLGRGLISLLSTPEPPTLAARTRKRAGSISRQAQHFAGDLGGLITDHASDAGDFVLRTAGEARTQVSRKASEFSDEVNRRAAEVADAISESAARAAGSTRAAAHDTSDYVFERADQSRDVLESFLGTVKVAAADLVARKFRGWLRRA